MIRDLRLTLFGASVLVAISSNVFAQSDPPIPPPAPSPTPATNGQVPLYDPQQLPAYGGLVLQFTLTPRGDIDGLILTDGTEVKTPPHLSTALAFTVKPGDKVTVHGLKAAALPLVQAASVTDEANGRTVVDAGPPGPGEKRRRPPPEFGASVPDADPVTRMSEVQGRIRMVLHGPRGDVNGALLEDGTILRLPPPEAYRLAALLQAGRDVVAEGFEFTSPIGKMLDVRELGPSRDQLSVVEPGKGGKKGHRPPPPAEGFVSPVMGFAASPRQPPPGPSSTPLDQGATPQPPSPRP